jgi:hypothetical protein
MIIFVSAKANVLQLENQVTPFALQTPDGESVYAWHILPLPLYLQNEAALAAQASGFSPDITETESFRLLKEEPDSKVVLYCKI